MNQGTRFAALIAVTLLVASCATASRTASATPSAGVKQPAKGGPVFSSRPPTSSAKCAVGATNEPLWSFAPPKMADESTGWGIGLCTLAAQPSFPNGSTINCYAAEGDWMGILRTSNGGATWTDVSPPSVTNRTWHHAQFFLDANHAWVEEISRTADACASQATTFMTSDGGATWHQGGSVVLKLSSPQDDVFNVAGPTNNMEFIDPQHGWLDVASAPATPSADPSQMTMRTTVYTTSDGGMNWRSVATNPGQSLLSASGCPPGFYAPASDPMFVSDTTGWLAVGCSPGVLMLITHDGGATWAARPLPSCSCRVYLPRVLDASHVLITGSQGSPSMLATADGGTTWVQRQVPSAATTAFSFIDPDHGWMVGIAQLPSSYETVVYRTADGGQHWSLVAKPGFTAVSSNPKAYFPVSGVRFLSDTTGFVVLDAEAGPNGQVDPSAPTLQILKTSDGGRSWSVVLRQIPAAPCNAKYGQLFGGGVDLWPVKLASATTAWAKGGLRTTDLGAHWKDVSSPALREGAATTLYPPSYADFYLDADHAWQAAVYGSKTTCTDHVSVFASVDGGATWQQSAPIALNVPSAEGVTGIQMGFTTTRAGWLYFGTGIPSPDGFGSAPTGGSLYTTADGGLSWRHVNDVGATQLKGINAPAGSQNCKPAFSQMTFSSTQLGWVTLYCADTDTLVTQDGGLTWKPSTQSFGGALPTFVDASHGFVQTYMTPANPSPALMATSDGGGTWHALTSMPSTGLPMASDFVDASNLFLLLAPPGWNKGSGGKDWLYQSTDGGQSWKLVQQGVPLGRVNSLLFADGKAGLVAQPRNATWSLDTAGFADANDTVIDVTTDGGKTWKEFKPAIDS